MIMRQILSKELTRMGPGLHMLETGSIRSVAPEYEVGDGWSTLAFAEHVRETGGSFVSIDLDTSAAEQVLTEKDLRTHVDLREGNSLDVLPQVVKECTEPDKRLDVVLLDSDNDADLILNEFLVVKEVIRPGGVLLVDDVDLEATGVVKGHQIHPHLVGLGLSPEILVRHGGAYSTGVLRVEL